MIKKITLGILLLSCSIVLSQTTIFSKGTNWKYLDDGSNQGTSWYGIGFNDSAWASGDAELGFGDGDEITTVADVNQITTYFRKSFNATAAEVALANLELDLTYDDAAVIYLNGVEVWRVNISGAVNYTTLADSDSGDNATASTTIANTLSIGTNIIAVEIHQRSATSSDISFDLSLKGNAITSNYITDTDTWKYLDDGSNQGASWRNTSFNDTSWSSGSAELGYGDGDESTVVSYGSDSNNKHITTYFRNTFNVPDASIYGDLTLEAIRDDAIAVYLNGTLVWTDNLPGSFNYTTLSTGTVGGSDEDTWISNTIANTLVNGNNVIAVEIHQADITSSDISFNFRLTANGIVPAEIVRGPYLQKGFHDRVTIKYRTNTATETIVNYGTALGSLSSTASDLTKKINHEIELTGLSPNTTYYYEIENLNDGVYVPENVGMFIKTAPATGTNQFVRAWILGDAGTADNNQRNVRDEYYNYVSNTTNYPNQTDMMLFLGDNAYDSGTDTEYQNALFDVYDDMLKKSVAWSCLGNHDGYTADSNSQTGPYYDIFTFPTAAECGGLASGTEAYYSFDYANIHFIILDSYETDRSVGGTMYNWCLNDIQNTTQDWIVALFHHPPYTKGSHDSDDVGDSSGAMRDMREDFLPILEANGVDLVLNGHSHSYERSFFINGHYDVSSTFNSSTMTIGTTGNGDGKIDGNGAYIKPTSNPDGSVYITTGSAGKISGGSLNHAAMYYSANNLGSCALEVNGNEMHVKFIRENGAVDDYFTIYKGDLIYSSSSWSPSAPTSSSGSDNAVVADGTYTINSDVTLNHLSVSGTTASVEVTPSGSLTTNGNIINNGEIVLNSISTNFSSLITNYSVSGTTKYKRHINAFNGISANDLITSPLSGQTFENFATNNPNIYENPSNTNEKLFGPFNKTTGSYQIYSTAGGSPDLNTILTNGIGFRAARDATEDGISGTTFTFEGEVITSNVAVSISNSGPSFAKWNLVGNPYSSYIKLADFLSTNNTQFESMSSGVYGYDGDASNGWKVWNQAYSDANPNALISPGQGFFVSSQNPTGTINFLPSMRSIGSDDDFINGRVDNNLNISNLELTLSNSSSIYSTNIYITDNASKGLDIGYDSSVYNDIAPGFAIYSHLVEDNQNIDMAIQSVNFVDLNTDLIIPLGINANQGEQLTIEITNSTLPEDINVYLQDTNNNIFTLLNTSNFVITPSVDLNQTGRFYLHFTNTTLSNDNSTFDNITIYSQQNPKTIIISGAITTPTEASIFDINGRLIKTKSLNTNQTQNIVNVNNISIGIYLVKLSSENNEFIKKVIIN